MDTRKPDPVSTVKDRAISALKWVASARLATQVITWSITIYVVRILTPEDYGVMSMASVFLGLGLLVNGIGIVPAFIQQRHVDRRLEQQVFGFLLVCNALVFLALQLSAPYFAAFFGEQRLEPIIRVLSLNILIGSISSIKAAALQRELRFKGLSIVEVISTLFGSFATLYFAISGLGVWSLVLGAVLVNLVRSALLLLIDRTWVGPVFRFGDLRRLASFGVKFTLQQVVFYFNSHIDVVIVGKILGNQVLGLYSTGLVLSLLPVSKSMAILNQVIFPSFSRLQDNAQIAGMYFFKSIRLTSLVFFPLLWGISSISHEFVEVVLGNNWKSVEIILLILPLAIPFRAVQFLTGPVLNGLGHGDIVLANNLTFAVIIPVAIVLGISWDLAGISVALAAGLAAGALLCIWRSLKALESSFSDLSAALVPSLAAAAVMYCAVLGARSLLPDDADGLWRLIGLVSAGAISYLAATLAFNRETLKEFMGVVLRPQAQ